MKDISVVVSIPPPLPSLLTTIAQYHPLLLLSGIDSSDFEILQLVRLPSSILFALIIIFIIDWKANISANHLPTIQLYRCIARRIHDDSQG